MLQPRANCRKLVFHQKTKTPIASVLIIFQWPTLAIYSQYLRPTTCQIILLRMFRGLNIPQYIACIIFENGA